MPRARRMRIVVGLGLALGLPFAHLSTLGKRYSGFGPLWGGEVFWWTLFAALIGYVLVVERKPLSSVGFRRLGLWDVGLAVIAAAIAIAGVLFILSVVLPALHIDVTEETNALYATPLLYRVLLVTRAAFVEELAFRGYSFERITDLSGRTLVATLATFVLFAAAHYPGGGAGDLIVAAWGSVVLTALYIWRRNLWSNIICHWVVDCTGFVLVPVLSSHH